MAIIVATYVPELDGFVGAGDVQCTGPVLCAVRCKVSI